jgi:hypothetical protein
MFHLITLICAIVCGVLILTGALIHILPLSRKTKVISGVSLCLGSITILTAVGVAFIHYAPVDAVKVFLYGGEYYENTPVNPCIQTPQIPGCR